MEFGIQFFPDVAPEEKTGQQYFDECLRLTELCDPYGYTHVRTVEHYFNHYGGYSPNPHLFLTAASQRTKKARLITGAVLPIFNHPLKIAGEIGMLDSISNGRLECGFGRAFLPHEFVRFERSVNDSRASFDEGVEQVMRLLTEENVSCEGKFHSFQNVTSLPRPVQKPRPPCWTAAVATPETLIKAASRGHNIMLIPMAGHVTKGLIETYRAAWEEAGHPGMGRIMLAHHMFCHEDAGEAERIAKDPLNRYLTSLVESASDWMGGASSDDYPGYDKIIAELANENYDSQVEKGVAWIGTPQRIIEMVRDYEAAVGGFDLASLQVNFNTLSYEDAASSMRLFGEKVIPQFAGKPAAAAE